MEPEASEHSRSYLLRHWRGELSLPLAYKELCESILAFYDEILALPPSESGPLLRFLASAD